MAAEKSIRLPGAPDGERFDRLARELLTAQLEAGLAELASPAESVAPGAATGWWAFRPLRVESRRAVGASSRTAAGAALGEFFAPRLAGSILALEDAGAEFPCAALLEAARSRAPEALAMPVGRGSRIRSWLAARQRSRSAATILAPARSWSALASYLERRRLRFRLAAAALVWCGNLHTWRDTESLATDAARHLGLEPHAIDLLVDLGTCASPLLVGPTEQKGRWRAQPLPWTALEVVDPHGRPARAGLLAILDLATRDRPAYQLSELEAGHGEDGLVVRFPPSVAEAASADRSRE